MIVLEGPDGSGKTTLANRIADEFGLEYRRGPLSPTTGATIERYAWWCEQLRADESYQHQGVYDRCWWISEPIYQMVQATRELLVSGPEMRKGISDLWVEGPLLIFCLPPWGVAQINIRGRERLEGVDDRALEKVHWLYHTFYALWRETDIMGVEIWDYTQDQFASIYKAVDRYLGKRVASGSL